MGGQVTISFPGLGIGEFTVNKVAFTVFGFPVHWYAIIIVLGIFAGVGYAMLRTRQEEGIGVIDIADFAIWTVLLGVVCARLYYVLTSLDEFESFGEIFSIWEGGIAIYGGIIGGACAILLVSKVKKYKRKQLLQVFDMVAPGVMLGQIIGRFGNFINGEAHGTRIEDDFFLRMGLMGDADVEWNLRNQMTYYHPTFLYESLWNLVGFVIINILYKKKKFDGQIFLMYLAWYGFGRMLIEGLRTDSLMLGALRVSQLVGFLCFVVCTALLVYFAMRCRRQEKDKEDYTSVYERSRGVRLGAVTEDAAERIISEAEQKDENNEQPPESDGEKE
ncbi:MAG: prolipoprotein diacylglyceryl transferase [Clostridia bacterium]|nr:prolipoprotein diacylglyceryl transferase [Clostridia bacterium]